MKPILTMSPDICAEADAAKPVLNAAATATVIAFELNFMTSPLL
jgi:hypothetical protein